MAGKYTRSPERGFRKFAMAFWDAPRSGEIYGSIQMDVTKARRFQKDVAAKYGVYPSIGMLMGRAVARALTETPQGNAKIIWRQAYVKDTVDVYFQVDIGDGKDLSGVVVPDTGSKSIVEVAETLRDRANRLRAGEDEQYEKTQKGCIGILPSWVIRPMLKLFLFLEYNLGITPSFLGARPEPFGTVMVTNVSKFGIDVAYAPLVPVSRVGLVVLVGQVEERPWVVDGELCVRPMLTGSATFDHRLLDGNKIGRIVRAVRAYMENPYPYEEVDLPEPEDAGVYTREAASDASPAE